MTYDFTSRMDRRGMDAIVLDAVGRPDSGIPAPREGFDPIPMWIADMNFPVCPAIPEAIIARAREPHYGYFQPRDEYYDAIIRWHERRNGAEGLRREHIGYENGVLGGVISALNVLCSRGDSVLMHTPTYIGFTKSLANNGYRAELSELRKDADGVWRMDFEDMERRIAQKHIHAAIFCSPHNPCGRVWERWELERFAQLCAKYDVFVISDEIWSDILRPGHRHIPLYSVSENMRARTVALYAPSKTFNLAGLIGAYHIICDPRLRDRVEKESSLSHYNDMNVLSMHALLGAYSPEGYAWADELCRVIAGNVDYACDYIGRRFEGVEVFRPQGTYMLFLDGKGWLAEHGQTLDELLRAGHEVGVIWQDGRPFHGPSHIRVNLALPLSRVQEAFDRLDRYVFNA